MRKLTTSLFALGVVACTAAAFAGAVVVPNAAENQVTGLGLNTAVRDLPRAYMMGVDGAQLSAIPVGANITGVAWRLYDAATAPWPAAATTWPNYLLQFGSSLNDVGLLSTNFAANQAANTVTCRTGPLTIAAGAFPWTAASPKPFGPCLDCTTPFVYPGGDFLMMIRHPGSGGPAAQFLQSVNNATGAGATHQALSATTENGAVGTASTFTVSKIYFQSGGGAAVLDITKELAPGQPDRVPQGATVLWRVTITNTGGPLTNGSLTDTAQPCLTGPLSCAEVQCTGGVNCGMCTVGGNGFSIANFQLAAGGQAGDSITYEFPTRATINIGTCTNSAHTTDAGECGAGASSDDAAATVEILAPATQESIDMLEAKLDQLVGTNSSSPLAPFAP